MIDNLRRLTVYVAASKIFQRPLNGHDGQCESDLTRLKRGIRYNSDLDWHEAYYRALDRLNLLSVFQGKFPEITGLKLHSNLESEIKSATSSIEYYEQMAQQVAGNPDSEKHYAGCGELHKRYREAYQFLLQVQAEAINQFGTMPVNRSKNIEWKDLTSVQFYKYDRATNSFVETTEKG